MVLHEEHHHHHHHQSKCKSSSSKKNKAKKVPQRGLGVAQLEKLRIEEQQKSSSAVAAAASLSSSSNPSHSLVLPAVAASPQPQKQPCFPFLATRSATSPSSTTAIDFFKADPIGFSAGNAEELKYLSSVWAEESGCFSNFDVPEGAMLENCGTSRSQHHHHHQYISPIRLIGNKAAFIPMSSGASSLQVEPPSNQNHIVGSLRREEERIAGTNLPWPFHPETAMSFPYRVPHFSTPFLKPEESASMNGKIPLKFSKEGASSSSSHQADWRNSEVHSNKRIRENGTSADRGGFLTLGSSSTQATSRTKQAVAILPEFSLLQSQGATAKQPANSSENTFYSFLPMVTTSHETDAKEENSEAVDDVDTSLKL